MENIKTIKDFDHLYNGSYWLPGRNEKKYIYLEDYQKKLLYAFDYTGKLIFEIPYQIYETDLPMLENNRAIVCDNFDYEYGIEEKYALIDETGKLITDFIYEHVGEQWLDGKYIAAKRNGKYGFIEKDGNVIIDYQFDWVNVDTDWMNHPNYEKVDVLINTINDKEIYAHGIVDWNCQLIIEPIYKEIYIKEIWIDDGLTDIVELTKPIHLKYDKFILTDFEDNKFIWTYEEGLKETNEDFISFIQYYDMEKQEYSTD